MSTFEDRKFNAPALEKGLDVLEYLASTGSAQSQAEIAKGVDRSPNEIYRMLVALEGRGYLIRDATSGKYRLSLKLFHLARTHTPVQQLIVAAREPMEKLAAATGQSCHLGLLHNGQLLVAAQVRSPGPVSLSVAEGALFPLSNTVSGRVLLAHADDRELKDLISRDVPFRKMFTEQQAAFHRRLNKIRRAGYELAASEITAGVTDCAALIGMPRSELSATVAVSSLTSSINRSLSKKKLILAVKTAAAEINHRIGLDARHAVSVRQPLSKYPLHR